MKLSREPTDGERTILRWLLLFLMGITIMYLLTTWWNKSRDCRSQCTSQGLGEGTLRFHGGGRFNMGTYCECERSATRSDAPKAMVVKDSKDPDD